MQTNPELVEWKNCQIWIGGGSSMKWQWTNWIGVQIQMGLIFKFGFFPRAMDEFKFGESLTWIQIH